MSRGMYHETKQHGLHMISILLQREVFEKEGLARFSNALLFIEPTLLISALSDSINKFIETRLSSLPLKNKLKSRFSPIFCLEATEAA